MFYDLDIIRYNYEFDDQTIEISNMGKTNYLPYTNIWFSVIKVIKLIIFLLL